jgi:hypothetical protein
MFSSVLEIWRYGSIATQEFDKNDLGIMFRMYFKN